MEMTLKDRFLEAISNGELGSIDDFGVIVSLKEFKSYFDDVKSDYVNSFLPAAVIETGQKSISHTKYLFRIRKGIYRVHPDVLQEFKLISNSVYTSEDGLNMNHLNDKVEESILQYQRYRIN